MMMQELEALLKQQDKNIKFDYLNNHIHCYPHIINICSSHIIVLSTCISKEFFEVLKSKTEVDMVYSNIEGNNNDDNDDNHNHNHNNDNDNDNEHLVAQEIDVPELTPPMEEAHSSSLDSAPSPQSWGCINWGPWKCVELCWCMMGVMGPGGEMSE
jgi:hypothetical protein